MTQSASFTGNIGLSIPEDYIFPDDFEQFYVVLRNSLNNIAYSLNRKESALYVEQETITAQQYLPLYGTDRAASATYRPVFRMVVDFGALPNATSKSVAHGIPFAASYTATRIYGAATDPVSTFSYLPLPYASPTAANNIEVSVDGTNVVVTTGSDRTAYTRSQIVIEYMKNV